VPSKVPGWGKFTQAVSHHVFGDVDGHVPAAIMHGNGVSHHLREDRARSAPGANHFLLTLGIHGFYFFNSFGSTNGPFLSDLDIFASLLLG